MERKRKYQNIKCTSMDYKIIYEDDSELSDFEALNKGYRKDVILLVGQKK